MNLPPVRIQGPLHRSNATAVEASVTFKVRLSLFFSYRYLNESAYSRMPKFKDPSLRWEPKVLRMIVSLLLLSL
jgi:hypothetical protein